MEYFPDSISFAALLRRIILINSEVDCPVIDFNFKNSADLLISISKANFSTENSVLSRFFLIMLIDFSINFWSNLLDNSFQDLELEFVLNFWIHCSLVRKILSNLNFKTSILKGFKINSSAPVSNPSFSFSSPAFAVNISIGMWLVLIFVFNLLLLVFWYARNHWI